MDARNVSSEERYRQMANDIIDYLMDENNSYKYIRFFNQTPEELYAAMTTDTLCIETMENPTIPAEVGGYVFWGDLEIQFLRLVPNQTVDILWKLKSWPDSFFSRAEMTIEKIEDFTRIQVEFYGFPTSVEESEEIWEQEVWRPIIVAFAYKKNLMRWAQWLSD